MYIQEPKKFTLLKLLGWVITIGVFIYGTQHLWLSLIEYGSEFIGTHQHRLDPDLLSDITEGILLDAQFLCLLSVYTFLWVTATGRISTLGVVISAVGGHFTNAHFGDIYYFAEFILPNLFIASVFITPALMLTRIIPVNPSRLIALGAAGAITTIVTLFHVTLIFGLQNTLKDISRQAVMDASQSPAESLQSTCSIMKLECQFIEEGSEYQNGNPTIQKSVQAILAQTKNIQRPIVTGFDATEKHLSDLPAAKDEVFIAVAPAPNGKVIAIDLENYPNLRKRIAFYITLMSMAAVTAWQIMSIGLMFFHQRIKRRRSFL